MTDRPSSWVAGLGLALVAISGLGLAAYSAGYTLPWQVYLSTAAAALGLLPVLEWLVVGLLAWGHARAELAQHWQAVTAPPAPTLVEPEPEPEPPAPDVDEAAERAWRTALDRFFRAGASAGGFSIRKLEGVVGSDTWAQLTTYYTSDAGRRVLRDAGGSTGTVFGYGWSLDDVLRALALDKLPHPEGPAPVVELYVARATERNAPRQRPTPASRAVIDG